MIKSIWIEIRPALKCCHFCVTLNNVLSSELKMKLKKSNIEFDIRGESFCINFKDFTVEPLTMTSFKATNQCVSFRVQAECDFKFDKRTRHTLLPLNFGKEKSSIFCECDNPLTKEIVFERVLPLPSSDFSFSNIFCHLSSDFKQPDTTPKPNDCFYSDSVLVVNEENVTGCLRKNKFLKCNRCLMSVGTRDKNSVKFWISCIKIPFDTSTPLDHFKRVVEQAISNPVILFPKILLECEENETFLSLVVVDKNLVVSCCEENLILKNMEVVKVKYKYHPCNDVEVKQLKDDPFHSLHHIQVHKSLLEFSTKFLISKSKTIPPLFSKVDNECMAYLNL